MNRKFAQVVAIVIAAVMIITTFSMAVVYLI